MGLLVVESNQIPLYTLFPCFLHHYSYIQQITFSVEKFFVHLMFYSSRGIDSDWFKTWQQRSIQ